MQFIALYINGSFREKRKAIYALLSRLAGIISSLSFPVITESYVRYRQSVQYGLKRLITPVRVQYTETIKRIFIVMKITALIVLVACLEVSASSYGQKITLSQKEVSLEKVLTEIKKQTNYLFFYNQDWLKEAKKVSIHVKDASIDQALLICFRNQPLSYSIVDKTIILFKNQLPLVTQKAQLPGEIQSPVHTVSGQVTDAQGETLPGVSVRLKGAASGTVTDAQGKYSISSPDDGVLVFSYIGFVTQEVAVAAQTTVNVKLQVLKTDLNEVVVTALGIRREKKALSYAVTEVGGDNLTQARENNLGNALSGRVAGVNATSSATGPAGSSRVVIRGNGSLSGDNQPLYVVNGIPINSSNQGTPGTYGGKDMGDGLVSINPDDIETISVLKGGSAAALYGSRAANGVILITTKSGKAQQGIGVEFNSTYTLENPLSIPDWQYEYGSGTRGQKPTTQSEAVANGRTSWGARLDGSMVIQPDGQQRPYSPQPDNISNFYNTGNTFSNTLALSGGVKEVNFRFSASNMDNAGIVPNSSINRKTFNLSTNANLSDKILFEGRAQYSIENAKNRTSIGDFTANPTSSVGLVATSLDVRNLAPGYNAQGFETPWNDYVYVTNPYFAVDKVKNSDERRRFIGSFSARYNLTDYLYARGRLGIDYINLGTYDLTPTGILYNTRGTMSTGKNNLYETNTELLLGFEKTLGRFSVNALLGGNKMYRQQNSVVLSSGNFNVPFNYFISNGSSQTFTNTFAGSAINSVFGSADIGFNNYLYLSLTGRQDWFSTLSEESNSLFYPSAGLSFVLSEAWKARPSWMNYAKVRASWAQVGGGAPDPYGLALTYTAGSIPHLGQPLMTVSSATIPNTLRPYTSTTSEAGLELRTLKNRLSADITVYDRTTTNDIVSASVSPASSYNDVRLNVGKIKNRGIELLLTGIPVAAVSGGFGWEVSYNMSYNKNTVVKLADGLTSLAGSQPRTQNAYVYNYEGMPYGMIAGYTVKKDASGNTVYNNANGLPLQSALTPLGRGVPPLTMGLSNTFSYKNFSLGFLVDGKFGSVLYASTNAYGTFYGLNKMTAANGVRESGVAVNGVDQAGAPFSKTVSAQDYYQGIAFSITDQFVSDASFIKLRQVTFGYSLPKTLLSKTPFQSASLSLVARNLLLLYSGTDNVDPESSYSVSGNSQGLENFGVLPTRSFGLNLMVRF